MVGSRTKVHTAKIYSAPDPREPPNSLMADTITPQITLLSRGQPLSNQLILMLLVAAKTIRNVGGLAISVFGRSGEARLPPEGHQASGEVTMGASGDGRMTLKSTSTNPRPRQSILLSLVAITIYRIKGPVERR